MTQEKQVPVRSVIIGKSGRIIGHAYESVPLKDVGRPRQDDSKYGTRVATHIIKK